MPWSEDKKEQEEKEGHHSAVTKGQAYFSQRGAPVRA